MSRIAFMADVHVGNPSTFGGPMVCGVNARGQKVLAALEGALKAAADCDAVVICGDLFDTSNPSPQMVKRVMDLCDIRRKTLDDAPWLYILMGNHDMVSDVAGDNAIAPLAYIPGVVLVEKPTAITWHAQHDLVLIPFQTGDAREWFPDAVREACKRLSEDKPRVLAFHLGVADKNTPAFLKSAHDAIELEVLQGLMEECHIDFAYCGNWHNPHRWGKVIQCGALAPTGWDNPGWEYGMVHKLDTRTGLRSVNHIPGPRFVVASSGEQITSARVDAMQRKCELYLSLKGDAAGQLDEVRQMDGVFQARAVPDGEDAREATRAAAVAVRGAATLNDALARYIAQMPVGDGVERAKIHALAKKYLATGGNQ